VLEDVMVSDPANWQKYYSGTKDELSFKRKYSLSDRARYYLPDKRIEASLNKLMKNIDDSQIPVSLLSQYLPSAYARIRNSGKSAQLSAKNLMKARVKDCIGDYLYAVT
jgi:D-tagatose-1,6-bisphosphate aldolase subunit GatZ/KbaZ